MALEDQDRRRNAGAVEQVGGQADHGVEQVLVDQLLADFALAAAAKQHAVRDDHADAPVLVGGAVGHLDHVADEGVIAFALGRHAAPEAPVAIRRRVVRAPLVEREGRVGDDDVEVHQVVALAVLRVAQGVAPADVPGGHVHVVEQHVHHAKRPRAAVDLLPVDGVILAADLLGTLDQQRSAATGGVTDALAGLRIEQAGEQGADFGRGVELTGFLARARGEFADQVLVSVADHVDAADARGAQVEAGIVEVVEQVLEALVALGGPAERRLAVEADVAEDAFAASLCWLLQSPPARCRSLRRCWRRCAGRRACSSPRPWAARTARG